MTSLSEAFMAHYQLAGYSMRVLPGLGGVEVAVAKDGLRGEYTGQLPEYDIALLACAQIGLDVTNPPIVRGYEMEANQWADIVDALKMSDAGALANRPLASSVHPGYRYFATDERVSYVKVGELSYGAWVADRPVGALELETIKPSSAGTAVTLTNAGTVYGFDLLTTAGYVFDGDTVRVSAQNFSFTMSHTSTSTLSAFIQYNKNGGGTWYNAGVCQERSFTNLSGFGLGYVTGMDNAVGIIPAAVGGGALTPGDVFQVRIGVMRGGGSSGTAAPFINAAFGAAPSLVLEKIPSA